MRKIGLLLLTSIFLANSLQAKNTGEWDWVDEPTKAWFKSLRNSKGYVCCDVSDGHAAIWKRDDDGYQVIIEGVWYKVPNEAVLWRTPNKIGEAIVWYTLAKEIRCFLPESEV